MDADELVSAEQLWWAWAAMVANGDLPDDVSGRLYESDHVLGLDHGTSWLRMQRLLRGRAVLWGRTTQPPTPEFDMLHGAPDWARTDAVWRSAHEEGPEFLAWYAHGEWDSNTPERWDDSFKLFEMLRSVDPEEIQAARAGTSRSPVLVAARGGAELAVQGSLRKRLKQQIHRQMRDSEEIDRTLPDRPTLLARWLQVHSSVPPFELVVLVDEGEVIAVIGTNPVPDPPRASLVNVLAQLHLEEAGDESGAWLFARVVYDGSRIRMDRGFDSLPPWFTARGPSLETLSWEMGQRSPLWRPAWSALLPKT